MKQKKSFRIKNDDSEGRAYRAAPLNITGAKQSPPKSEPEDREKTLRDLNQRMDDTFRKLTAKKLTPADAPHLFDLLDRITESVERIDKENPTGPDEETDPRIVTLLEMGQRITDLLDPLVRENFKDNPDKLAEWDDIMRMRDVPEEGKDR
ncbi:MAG: hypothetical protein ICV60_04535 [Pyrinomonadaceae bacterium]|nr:hypothetical protein [Pyrinomonadaceae bacterium]